MKLPPDIKSLLVDLIDWTPYEVGDEGQRKMEVVYAKIGLSVLEGLISEYGTLECGREEHFEAGAIYQKQKELQELTDAD